MVALDPLSLRWLSGIAPSNVDCLGFSEVLAGRIAFCGEEPTPLAPEGLLLAAIEQAAQGLNAESPLLTFARSAGGRRRVLACLRDLHGSNSPRENWNAGIGPELAKLDEALEGLLAPIRRSTLSRELQRLLELEPIEGKLGRTLCLGGRSINAGVIAWLDWEARHGGSPELWIEGAPSAPNLFRRQRELASRLGVPIEPVDDGEAAWPCHLFGEPKRAPGPELVLLNAADTLLECEQAVRESLQLEPKQCAIVARGDTYAALLEASAKRLGGVLSIRRRAPLESSGFARFALSVLEALASPDVRRLGTALASSYFGLSSARLGEIRAVLARAWRAKGAGWDALRDLLAAEEATEPWLLDLVAEHRSLIVDGPLGGHVETLRRILALAPADPFVGERSGERDSRALAAMLRPLYHFASVNPDRDRRYSAKAFVALCRSLWSSGDYGVPSPAGGTLVASGAAEIGEVDTLIVVGLLEGEFPRRRREDALLGDEDRKAISPDLPTSRDQAEGEREEFIRLCARASRRLILSHPETEDSKDNTPSFFLDRAEALAENVMRRRIARGDYSPAQSELLADHRLRLAREAAKVLPQGPAIVTEAMRARLAWNPDEAPTPKDLRDAAACPFRFVARRRLGLRANRTPSRWYALRRLPQAARLHEQPDEEAALNALRRVLGEEVERISAECEPWEQALLLSGGGRLIQDWSQSEFAARRSWPRDAAPAKERAQIQKPEFQDQIGKTRLKGEIPLVSQSGGYTVLHLYEAAAPANGALDEEALAYFGSYLFAGYKNSGRQIAVDIAGLDGKRTLLHLAPDRGAPFSAQTRLTQVVNLRSAMRLDVIGADSVRLFYDRLREVVNPAWEAILNLSVEPKPGDRCARCEYGELCRSALEYGER